MTRISTLAFGLAATLAMGGAAFAQGNEAQAACREDVVKYCPTASKADDVAKCLVTNKDKLNATCKKAVETPRS
ncbi:MAG: hypothetical protein ACRCWO_07590 [Bosea sp. (in: a-proteobacteria)]